jgi:hypothetical protein
VKSLTEFNFPVLNVLPHCTAAQVRVRKGTCGYVYMRSSRSVLFIYWSMSSLLPVITSLMIQGRFRTIAVLGTIIMWGNTCIYCNNGLMERIYEYICVRKNVSDLGRVFHMVKYTDITQNTYVQS